jgi:hypothetical protein
MRTKFILTNKEIEFNQTPKKIMENLEKIIAKHLLSEYKMLNEISENFRQSKSDEAFIRGQIIGIKKIASSIWGKEKGLDSHFEFIENLKEIANT